ncbi:MAG: O-antigen ligase family protein [Candidatus Krumholzibacteriia bacterium]
MALSNILKPLFQIKYWLVAFAGALFSLVVWKIMALDFRFGVAVTAGLIVLSLAMMAIHRIEGFLLLSLVFAIPLAGFSKWLMVQHVVAVAKGISFGLAEVLVVIAYLVWFAQIFIARTRPIPKFRKIDSLILLLLFAQTVSLLGAPNKLLGSLDIIYNIKHILIFYFISHKIRYHHLKWVIVLLLFGIMVESPLALYERLTGNVGIGRTKGAVDVDRFGSQYDVPGVEQLRAEGTTTDSHALGEYLAMLLPVPFVLMMMRFIGPRTRLVLAGILVLGVGALIVTFSRAGWVSFGLAAIYAVAVMTLVWRNFRTVFATLVIVVVVSAVYPKVYEYFFVRFMEAPSEILQSRYSMNWTALGIWKQNFLFGYGPANYMDALSDPSVTIYGPDWLPVHNAFLFIASESGLVGVVAFFGIIFLAMYRCFECLRCDEKWVRAMSLAVLAALIAYLLDGLTNPTFRDPVPYALLWVYLALGVAFKRLASEGVKLTGVSPIHG